MLVHRITADSRDVRPGDLYVCIRGHQNDGHRFAPAAVQRGAAAIMAEEPVTGLERYVIGLLLVPDTAAALRWLAPRFYNHPSHKVRLIGVTGTNGKTTTTRLLRSIIDCCPAKQGAAHRTGIIGTIAHESGKHRIPAANTTPMAWDLQALLHRMVEDGCDHVVMEASSQALAEERTAGCAFDIALFTNLTPEHLDYHKTMEAYAQAKALLFKQLAEDASKPGPRAAVIHQDDPWGPTMRAAAGAVPVITFGLSAQSMVRASDIQLGPGGSRFVLTTPKASISVRIRLLGLHNVVNALGAAAAALALGVPERVIREGLSRCEPVAGRLEKVIGTWPYTILVDYAHTTDALQRVLAAVREITKRRIILVFGCGGDRDPGKRAPMGQAAAEGADVVLLTSDNPRGEDPQRIIEAVLPGIELGRSRKPNVGFDIEPDRSRAIRKAVNLAKAGDTVLIAGKGHETYQLIGGRTLAFDDRKVAKRWALARQRKKGA
jgi:UDP-N-acetylmuramoyl-L-alanyl-D-glutamate--2,6-diaminopimelate ligase